MSGGEDQHCSKAQYGDDNSAITTEQTVHLPALVQWTPLSHIQYLSNEAGGNETKFSYFLSQPQSLLKLSPLGSP